MCPSCAHENGRPLPLLAPQASIGGMDEDYQAVIRELEAMQERLRALRFRLSAEVSRENVRYHAFSSAVSHLNRAIADLRKDL